MRSNLRLFALLLCLALLAGPLAARAARADCGLANNGFEGGFTDRNSGGHVIVANGWDYWFQDGPGQDRGLNWRPTYRDEPSSRLGGKRVHGGSFSQKLGTLYATHNAGLYQRVGVPRGSQVTFTVWAQVWSSNNDDDYSITEPGNYAVSVGIDPTGGTNWAASSVRWSEPRMEYNNWLQLSISVRAEADAVTVFTRGQCEYSVKHNESVWDDACLTVVRPTPAPTNTPRATNTPTITPSPTASPTPVLVEVCVQSFDDANGNGVRDAGEPPIPGAAVSLLDAAQVEVATCLTSGYEEPYCFGDLPAGGYTLAVRNPAGYEALGEIGGALTLVDAPVKLELAYQRFPTATSEPATATPVPTATPTPRPASGSILATVGRGLYSISGILVALLAVVILVAPRYLRLGQ